MQGYKSKDSKIKDNCGKTESFCRIKLTNKKKPSSGLLWVIILFYHNDLPGFGKAACFDLHKINPFCQCMNIQLKLLLSLCRSSEQCLPRDIIKHQYRLFSIRQNNCQPVAGRIREDLDLRTILFPGDTGQDHMFIGTNIDRDRKS